MFINDQGSSSTITALYIYIPPILLMRYTQNNVYIIQQLKYFVHSSKRFTHKTAKNTNATT